MLVVYDVPIFTTALILAHRKTGAELHNYLLETWGIDDWDNYSSPELRDVALTVKYQENKVVVVWYISDAVPEANTIIHESLHAATAILETCGVEEFGFENQEPLAYLLEHIVTKTWEFLKLEENERTEK